MSVLSEKDKQVIKKSFFVWIVTITSLAVLFKYSYSEVHWVLGVLLVFILSVLVIVGIQLTFEFPYKEYYKWLYFFKNRLHFEARFSSSHGKAKFILNEKYRKPLKYIKYILTVASLLSAFLTFENKFHAFILGLSVFVIISIIEKFIFSYKSYFVTPVPNFEIESEKWLGASFEVAVSPDNTIQIPIVGILIQDEEYARKLHSLFKEWTFGKLNDKDCCINVSVIYENNNGYVIFIYPNMERKSAEEFFNAMEDERKKHSLTDIQDRLYFMIILGKRCEFGPNSYVRTFQSRYRDGVPYKFQFQKIQENGGSVSYQGLDDFTLYNLKFKNRSELTRKDVEYDMFNLF